ncbi:MAG TPA: hypothetical protein VHL11_25745 [Phototrophicaceae bacterium]|jgi:hypothetical protein|nr:hypothetical protein [Phototrophicaceae bacterium]
MDTYNLMQQAEIKREELIRDADNARMILEINRTRRAERPTPMQWVRMYLMLPLRRPQPVYIKELRPVDQEG